MGSSDDETTIASYAGQARAGDTVASLRQTEWRNVSSQRNTFVVAHASLVVVSMLALMLYVLGTPVYFSWFFTPCTNCSDERLTVAKMQALHALGISTTTYAAYWTGINLLFVLTYCVVAAFIVWRKPTDRMALFAAFFLVAFGTSFSDIPNALATVYSVWRLPVALLDVLGLPSLTAFLFLFPSGRFVPHWTRWIVVVFTLFYTISTFFPGSVLSFTHWPRLLSLPVPLTWLGSLVFAQVYRYRRVSTVEERQQTKWVVFGATIALVGFLLLAFLPLALLPEFFSRYGPSSLSSDLFLTDSFITGVYLVLLLIPCTLAIAILRYRLWDIDILINRTLVYGGLTASVIGLYILIVGVIGVVLRAEGNLLISLLATGLVAILFQPLRERLQRSVNRLLYGQRDEPYTVIARLSQRLKEQLSPNTVLFTIVETLAQALKLPYAAIFWKQGETLELATSYGTPVQALSTLLTLPLVYQTETIGLLQLAPRTHDEVFTPADMRLLDELVRQAGLAAHAVRLANDLQKAREHLVLAREEERRRLRRDLHDGVGPTLASLSQRIDTACYLIPHDPNAAIEQLRQLKAQVKATIADIRRVVYALRPPILDELGLVSAIREHVMQLQGDNDLHISVDAPDVMPSLPAAVEVAAYSIVLEALTNVVRHANARHCAVYLEVTSEQWLSLSIVDDGCGMPDDYHSGVGITSIRERVVELGGRCSIISEGQKGWKGQKGTHVDVWIPLKQQE